MPVSGAPSTPSGGRRSSRQLSEAPIRRSGSAIRSTGRRRIESSPSSVQAPPGCPASQPGSRRSRVPALPTSIAAPVGALQPDAAIDAASPRADGPSAPSTPALRAPRPPPGSSGCRRRRGSPRSSSPPPPSPRSAPPGGRSTCRRAAAGRRAGARRARSGLGTRLVPVEDGDRVARARSTSSDRAARLLVAGDPERDRARGHVGRRVQRHVLDVDAGLAERQRELGDRPRPVGDDDPQLAQRAAAELGLEQAAAVLAGGRVPGGDRLAVAGADQLAPPRAGARRPRRPRRRPPRGWWRRCRPRSPGWSRRPGSCRGSSGRPRACRSESRVSSAAASAARALASDVRQVADRRHQPVVRLGVDRLRAGAERRRRVRCRRS